MEHAATHHANTTPTGAPPAEPPAPRGRLIPVPRWPDFHPWPSPSGLRNLIFASADNGLDEAGAILRIGRRVLVDEDKFLGWARTRGAQQ